MSSDEREQDRDNPATDVRLTFRTYKTHVEKLERIAEAKQLTIGDRPSVGKAVNYVIEQYDDSAERKQLQAKKKKGKRDGRR